MSIERFSYARWQKCQLFFSVACLLGAKFNTDKMLKQVTCGKLFHFKSVSWICSARPYPPSAGREFRFSGFATVSSIPSLSGIHFIHSVRKSALLNYSGCRRSNVRPTPHGLKPYRKFASWICSALTEFRLSGFTTVGSICSLSGIHFIHSVRKSATSFASILLLPDLLYFHKILQ